MESAVSVQIVGFRRIITCLIQNNNTNNDERVDFAYYTIKTVKTLNGISEFTEAPVQIYSIYIFLQRVLKLPVAINFEA